jgi:hypothetical protein
LVRPPKADYAEGVRQHSLGSAAQRRHPRAAYREFFFTCSLLRCPARRKGTRRTSQLVIYGGRDTGEDVWVERLELSYYLGWHSAAAPPRLPQAILLNAFGVELVSACDQYARHF